MATLREYFAKDGSNALTIHQTLNISDSDGSVLMEVVGRLHLDFVSNAKYVSFYIPPRHGVECPELLVLRSVNEILRWHETTQVWVGFGSERISAFDLVFTGRIYLYSEQPVRDEHRVMIETQSAQLEHKIIFRSEEYVAERNRWEKPLAFISHDSRDKAIAEKLEIGRAHV